MMRGENVLQLRHETLIWYFIYVYIILFQILFYKVIIVNYIYNKFRAPYIYDNIYIYIYI